MILINNGANPLAHSTYKLAKGAKADIPDDIAKIWLDIRGVERYIAPADLEKAEAEAKAKTEAEKKAYEAEIEKLKAEITDLKKGNTEAKAKIEAKKKA